MGKLCFTAWAGETRKQGKSEPGTIFPWERCARRRPGPIGNSSADEGTDVDIQPHAASFVVEGVFLQLEPQQLLDGQAGGRGEEWARRSHRFQIFATGVGKA